MVSVHSSSSITAAAVAVAMSRPPALPLLLQPTDAVPPFAYDVPSTHSRYLYSETELEDADVYTRRLDELNRRSASPPSGVLSHQERRVATGRLVVVIREAIRLMEWLHRRSAEAPCTTRTWCLRTQFLDQLPQSPHPALAGELVNSYWVLGVLYNWLLEVLHASSAARPMAVAADAAAATTVAGAASSLLKVLDWLALPPSPTASVDHRRIFRDTHALLKDAGASFAPEARTLASGNLPTPGPKRHALTARFDFGQGYVPSGAAHCSCRQ